MLLRVHKLAWRPAEPAAGAAGFSGGFFTACFPGGQAFPDGGFTCAAVVACARGPAPTEGFRDLGKQVPNHVLPVDQPLGGDCQNLMYDACKLYTKNRGGETFYIPKGFFALSFKDNRRGHLLERLGSFL